MTTMNKCRICLKERKNVRSIFDTTGDQSFADMMMSVANIKIVKNDGLTEMICLTCRKNLLELYEFKTIIERSDAILQNLSDWKRIHFNSLKDIKIMIEIADNKEIVPKQENIISEIFKTGEECVQYNDTVIKKANTNEVKNEPLPVLEFLETIKEDSNHELSDNHCSDDDYVPPSDDSDDDYLLPLAQRVKQKYKKTKNPGPKKKIRSNKQNPELQSVYIKPVYVEDIRVLPTKMEKRKPKLKSIHKKKLEMCSYCGKMVTNIKDHILKHIGEKPYKCDECGKAFITFNRMKYHKVKHSAERKFKCDQCVAAFICKTTLKAHLLTHTDIRQFICSVCNKGFKRKHALRRHIKRHNIANKTFKCDMCSMSFFTRPTLNHHLRVHTGERPFNCEICSQPYSYKHDFNRHCFKKHGVFLKQRKVYVMNEEVLKRERAILRDLMLRMQGFTKEGEPFNPFEVEGPNGALAFEQAIKMLKSNKIPIDFNY